MKRNAIFIVESPLQLICAFEAKHIYNIHDAFFVIRYAHEGRNNPQLEQVENILLAKEKRIHIYLPPSYIGFSIGGALKMLWTWGVISMKALLGTKVFVGYYNSRFAKMLTSLLHKYKITFLDDGVASLFTPNSILNSKCHFFSLFQLETKNYTRNDLKYFSRHLSSFLDVARKRENVVLFLGWCLDERNGLPIEQYLNLIERAKSIFPQYPFVYIPHRREKSEVLDQIKKSGTMVYSNRYPVEFIALELQDYTPYAAISFSSTALFTLHKIYGLKIFSLDITQQVNRVESKVISQHISQFGNVIKV